MTHVLRVVRANGEEIVSEHERSPRLEVLQAAVGGFLELVPYFGTWKGERATVYCNEEGKLRGLFPNRSATIAWHECLSKKGMRATDILVGDVAIITTKKNEEKV